MKFTEYERPHNFISFCLTLDQKHHLMLPPNEDFILRAGFEPAMSNANDTD
jgi:hypothetical protein